MQKTDEQQKAPVAHRKVQSSTTLNRRYVRRPAGNINAMAATQKTQKIVRPTQFANMTQPRMTMAEQVVVHPIQSTANEKMRARQIMVEQQQSAPKMTAQELKDKAIQKALKAASEPTQEEMYSEKKKGIKMHFGFGRIILAMACAAAAVFAIVYFVNLNMPDISLKVAAMQTGINASYPNYVPRNYSISSITSENGKISLDFKNSLEDKAFSLTEESSSWDSNALLSNFVKPEYDEDYSIVREQGLTIYINKSNATWVNGGVVYKITAVDNTLTTKQIRSIAVSL